MTTYVMGDIHGGHKALLQCLQRSGFDYDRDILIQLGDIADGFDEVFACVEELLTIRHLVAIKGNHDDWLQTFIRTSFHPQYWSQGGEGTLRSYLTAAGKQDAMYEAITAGEKDYSALVSKLKQADIDVVFLGGYHTEAGLIVRQMRDQGMATVLMGGDALITQEYWSITGPAGEGTLMTFSPDPRKNPAAAEVVKRFKDKGIEPEGYVLYTYAAIQAWKQAAEKAKSVASADVVKALNDNEIDTVIGKFKFNEKGDPNLPPYAVYRWSNGTYEEISEQALQ